MVLLPDAPPALYPRYIEYEIPGVLLTSGHVHLQAQVIADGGDFATPDIDLKSKDDQTNWEYSSGTGWTAWPAGGVEAYLHWVRTGETGNTNPFGGDVEGRFGSVGYMGRVKLLTGLGRNRLCLYRIRQYCVEAAEYDTSWKLGSFRT